MNILFVMYIGFDKNGPSVHLLKEIIEQCLIAGHNVNMIVRNRGGNDPDVPVELQKYENLHCDVIYDSPLEKSALVKRYFEDIRYAFKCRKIYRKYRDTDVVFLQSHTSPFFSVSLLKKTLKKPVLFNVQNIFPNDALVLGKLSTNGVKGIVFRVFRKMQQIAYKEADRLVTISDDMKETLVGEGVSPDKIRVIYNWSYNDNANEIAEEDNLFLKDHENERDKFRVVFAGNLGAMVNADLISQVAIRLKDENGIQFVVIGDGNNMNYLKKASSQNELKNISFYPYQPEGYANHNYAMANININALPKGIIYTCMPSKTATMLNSARPMVVSVEKDSNYAKMLNEVDKCKVVDVDDVDGFVEAILDLYKNNESKYSDNARDVFKKYCSCKNAQKYVEEIEAMTGNK